MIEEIHRLAMAQLRHHLYSAGVTATDEDGDLCFLGHRLNVAIEFDGLVPQNGQQIAPVDLRLSLDGGEDDRFRVGVLGVGRDAKAAMQSAIAEWHLLAAAPLLAALGAPEGNRRRPQAPPHLLGWDFFPGRAAVRGSLPDGLQESGSFQRSLLLALRDEVGTWTPAAGDSIRSLFLMVSTAEGALSVQAAVDGLVSEALGEKLAALPWPNQNQAYFYKQLFVLRHAE